MRYKNFDNALVNEMLRNRDNDYSDNYDFGKGPEISSLEMSNPAFQPVHPPFPVNRKYPALRKLLRPVKRNAFALRNKYRASVKPLLQNMLSALMPRQTYRRQAKPFESIGFLYGILADQYSKDILIRIFAYRILGHRKVKLQRNNPDYWQNIDRIQNCVVKDVPSLPVEIMKFQLPLHDLASEGFNLRTYCSDAGGAIIFKNKQYEYHHGGVHCKAGEGDVAIDAGGCWGETSLYFAHEVGEKGKVYSFEFIPSNLKILYANIEMNPHLKNRIEVVEFPIWEKDDQKVYYVDWGPGSRVSFSPMADYLPEATVSTVSIDGLVKDKELTCLDFIKMDIEGAELNALKGAEQSLIRFRPKLAISLYHSVSDFTTIPQYLESLNLNYKYYLDHHTIYENETVLFAVPQP